MPFIDWEIVFPFMDDLALVRLKVLPEIHRFCSAARA
jgi:hypothetical protein